MVLCNNVQVCARRGAHMAGLGLFYQKSALAVTIPVATAFKFCIGHRKNGLLNR
jgi:hypothetical protein